VGNATINGAIGLAQNAFSFALEAPVEISLVVRFAAAFADQVDMSSSALFLVSASLVP
jgi:hypothetical protein